MLTQTMMQTLLMASLQTFAPAVAALVTPAPTSPILPVPPEIAARVVVEDRLVRAVDSGRRSLHEQQRLQQATARAAALHAQVTVQQAPGEHVGLGTGTQLGLSVVAGLSRFLGMPDLSTGELAAPGPLRPSRL